MNSTLYDINNKTGIRALLLCIAIATAGCKGGGGAITSTGTPNLGGGGGAIAVTKVYPSASGENWTAIKLANRFYIKGLSLSVKGTCARGIDKIKVHEGVLADYTETATCLNDGSFVWNRTYPALTEADMTLTLTGYDINDVAVAGAATTTDVRVDSVVPTAPAIAVPAAGADPYPHAGGSPALPMSGTITPGEGVVKVTVSITGIGSVDTTFGTPNWNYTLDTSPAGSTKQLNFYAWDLAGNSSAATPRQVAWQPDVSLAWASDNPTVGTQADDTANAGLGGMEATVGAVGIGTTSHAGSNFSILTGFNYIVNKLRN